MKHMKKVIFLCLLAFVLVVFGAMDTRAATSTGHTHPVCGKTCSDGQHTAVNWAPFPGGASMLAGGNYYLTGNETLSSTLNITGPVTICLNNCSLITTSSNHCISVTGSGSLTLCDCGTEGKLSNTLVGEQGKAAIGLYESANMTLYSGTVIGNSFDGIYCENATGDLNIYGGTVKGNTAGIDINWLNNFTMTGGTVVGATKEAVITQYNTYNSISVSGGLLEGYKGGLRISNANHSGTLSISGGTFKATGTVPNGGYYSYEYYGLSLSNSNFKDFQVDITGGNFSGGQGGVYTLYTAVTLNIYDGVFGNSSTPGLCTEGGQQNIYGGQIYGIKTSGPSTVNIYDGDVLQVILTPRSTSTSCTLNVYGGTFGAVADKTSSWTINCALIGGSQNVNIYGGTITGTKYAIRANSTDSISISGGNLTGGIADLYCCVSADTPEGAYIDLNGYTGKALTVDTPSKMTIGQYIAKNVAQANLLSIKSNTYYALYDSANSAVKVMGEHTHTFGEWIPEIPATCWETGIMAHKDCTICDKHFDDQGKELTDLTVPVDPHNHESASDVSGRDPTCTKEGLTDGVFCSLCQSWEVPQIEIAALGHDFVNGVCTRCQEEDPDYMKGDINGDGQMTNDDVIAVLWHVLFPEDYPLDKSVDFNNDGQLTNDDVITLLWHVLFPEDFPL